MKILVTGFNGKVGFEVARNLKSKRIPMRCAVRDVDRAMAAHGDEYEFVSLDFAKPETFEPALVGINRIFLMYPPGENIQFEQFIASAKEKGVRHIVYLSVKDAQFMPFIHHYKNEKLLKKYQIPYTFLRAGYFMQNLTDFLYREIKERKRIFVPAGKGKTSFVDARDIAEAAVIFLKENEQHINKAYVITGDEALDFYQVASIMSDSMQTNVEYTNPNVKEFREQMKEAGVEEAFINVVVGIHFPTKLGFAKGIKDDYEKITGLKPTKMKQYIEDYKEMWK